MSLVLTPTMKWWEEWQLRILVLGSLLIQFILLHAPRLRRTRYRSILWLAYVVGDALAIYALATIFSRQKQHEVKAGVKASSLEVMWVPVLLIHLGGQPNISAYSLEDNELWRRHVVTLVIQVAVAIYSFCKWWFGDVKLLVAAILLFILGIIKYAVKPWALRKASFANLKASRSLSPRKKQAAVAACWTWWTSLDVADHVTERRQVAASLEEFFRRQEVCSASLEEFVCGQVCCSSLEEFVREATKAVQEEVEKQRKVKPVQEDIEAAENNQQGLDDLDWIIFGEAINKQLVVDAAVAGSDEGPPILSGLHHTDYFVDVIAPYSVRLRELRSFIKVDANQQVIKLLLYAFAKVSTMYSNARTVGTPLGSILHFILFPCLALASVVLFVFSRKDGYSVKDITVTYILLSCTCLMELNMIMSWVIIQALSRIGITKPLGPGIVFQYNLLSYYARKKEPTILMKFAIFDFLRDIVNKRWYVGEMQTALDINFRVLRHVIFGWNNYIKGDAAQYKRFNDMRGQLVLTRHEQQMERMGWSVSTQFDESVLLWHIATDLCYYSRVKSAQDEEKAIEVTRSISNYMIYLLLNEPEMLIPGARSALFSIASDSIDQLSLNLKKGDYSASNGEELIAKAIINAATQTEEDAATQTEEDAATQTEEDTEEDAAIQTEEDAATEEDQLSLILKKGYLSASDRERIAEAIINADIQTEEDTLVTRACKLAKELQELNEKKRWRVIHGMWIEMLCYSISRRRGYLQARYMGEHGDSLALVWILWAFMGMETWVERFHRLDHLEQDGGQGQAGKEANRVLGHSLSW